MIAKLRRPVALLLVLLTLFSLVPFGFADDFPTIQSESGVDPPTGETAPIEEGAATEPPAETTEPLTDTPTEAPTEAAAEETTQPPAEAYSRLLHLRDGSKPCFSQYRKASPREYSQGSLIRL